RLHVLDGSIHHLWHRLSCTSLRSCTLRSLCRQSGARGGAQNHSSAYGSKHDDDCTLPNSSFHWNCRSYCSGISSTYTGRLCWRGKRRSGSFSYGIRSSFTPRLLHGIPANGARRCYFLVRSYGDPCHYLLLEEPGE